MASIKDLWGETSHPMWLCCPPCSLTIVGMVNKWAKAQRHKIWAEAWLLGGICASEDWKGLHQCSRIRVAACAMPVILLLTWRAAI